MMIYFIIRFIRKNQIDVMVTNIEKEVIVGGIAARICGIPNIRRVGREDDFNEKLKVKCKQWQKPDSEFSLAKKKQKNIKKFL